MSVNTIDKVSDTEITRIIHYSTLAVSLTNSSASVPDRIYLLGDTISQIFFCLPKYFFSFLWVCFYDMQITQKNGKWLSIFHICGNLNMIYASFFRQRFLARQKIPFTYQSIIPTYSKCLNTAIPRLTWFCGKKKIMSSKNHAMEVLYNKFP